jgi:hypothetical protein
MTLSFPMFARALVSSPPKVNNLGLEMLLFDRVLGSVDIKIDIHVLVCNV